MRDVDVMFLDHLERRRGELAVAMWQAPALTFAAQAFLLIVITDDDIATRARAVVLAGGVMATLAAIIALLRLREREVKYSEAIAARAERIGMSDPRPHYLVDLKPVEGRRAWLDRGLRWLAGRRLFPPIHHSWVLALLSLIVADVIAFCATT